MPPPKKGEKTGATRKPKTANRKLDSPHEPVPRKSTPSKPSQPAATPPKNDAPPRRTAPPRTFPFRYLMVGGIAAFAFSTYGTYLYVSYQRAVAASKTLNVPHDVSDRYHKTAPTYDNEVDTAEWIMGLGRRRKEMVHRARGNVLEVSCGTGRNMEYYNLGQKRGVDNQGKAEVQGCRTVTFVDRSREMVDIAKSKFEKLYPGFKLAAFRTQDALEPIEAPPETSESASPPSEAGGQKKIMAKSSDKGQQKFDTVIQTMGICSHPEPVSLLRHLGTLTEPERGRIYLLEHGRSHYSWLNNLLDNLAPAHADRHGCWWNRDIGEVVRESGLEVLEFRRYHLGTTWGFVLRPRDPNAQVMDKEGSGTPDDKPRGWITWIPDKKL